MARDFTKNASNHLTYGYEGLGTLCYGASVLSLSAWIYADSFSAINATYNRIVVGFIDENKAGFGLSIDKLSSSSLVVYGRSQSADTLGIRAATTTVNTGQWYHVGGVLNYAGDAITPYVNGVAENGGAATFGATSYTNDGTPTSYKDTIGGQGVASTNEQFDGRIAEVAIWNVSVGSDMPGLADGLSPLLVRPGALLFYAPLLGYASPEIDLVGGTTGTIAGSVPLAGHPRMIYSRRHRVYMPGLPPLQLVAGMVRRSI